MDMKRTVTLAAVLVLVLAACGDDTADVPPLSGLTETYGCGYGFWIGDPDQTTALRFGYLGEDRDPGDTDLPDDAWEVVLLEGQDLYANWCDDVVEPGEPEPRVDRRLEVVRGSLEIVGEPPAEPFSGGPLALVASDLAVELPSGEIVELGDVTIENPSFGFLAG